MLKFKLFYIIDRMFYEKEGPSYRIVGNPIQVSKNYLEKGFSGFYVVDLNLNKGNSKNLVIYDELTSFTYVQVDALKNPKNEVLEKLYEYNARVTLYREKKGAKKEEVLINKSFSALFLGKKDLEEESLKKELDRFRDVVIKEKRALEGFLEKEVSKEKRIFFVGKIGKNLMKSIFCNIL